MVNTYIDVIGGGECKSPQLKRGHPLGVFIKSITWQLKAIFVSFQTVLGSLTAFGE